MPKQRTARRRRDLSLEEIARHAARIMREEGEAAVTMRRVAAESDVTAMAIYHHVGSKDELLTLVVDNVIGDAIAGAPVATDWRSSMVELACTFRAALLDNPGAGTVFLRRPILSQNLTRTTEMMFSILDEGGIQGPAVAEATDAIVLLTMGSVANDLTRPPHVRRQLVGRLPADEMPLLLEHIGVYSDRDGEQRFRLGLSWLLDGIERSASEPRTKTRSHPTDG
jgi:AcrR family transcriptional regulator